MTPAQTDVDRVAMRDHLIEIIETAIDSVHDIDVTHADYARASADAILAALPAMIEAGVPDLVWTWHKPQSVWRAQSILGEYEVDTHGSWTRTKCETIGKVHDGGKAAANAHHRAQILAALGLGVK